jgi:putative hemolysin
VFSGLETGSYFLNRVRLHYSIKKGRKWAGLLARNLSKPQIFIFTILVCNNLCIYLASSVTTDYIAQTGLAGKELVFLYGFFPWSAETGATFILTLPLFIMAELAPKNLFMKKAEDLMYSTALFQRICIVICSPVTFPIAFLAKSLASTKNKDFSSRLKNININQLKHFISEGHFDGIISDLENKMIHKTMSIHRKNICDLMTELSGASVADIKTKPSECLDLFYLHDLHRLPVYSGNKRNITGIVYFFDVLSAVERGDKDLSRSVKKVSLINSGANLRKAFYKMRAAGEQTALVKSAEGISGIIRMRDIIRYITSK